jgi:RHS repeat-associated protein
VSEWSVLGREDPVPGDPVLVRALSARLLAEAARIEDVTGRLRAVQSGGGSLRMEGDYAPAFTEALAELPDKLSGLGRAYRGCGDALGGFAASLEEAKGRAGSALRQGTDADTRYQGAVRELRAVLPPDRQGLLANGLSLSPASVDAATTGLEETVRTQVRAAAARAQVADQDLDRARSLADQAAALRGDAESRAVKGINDALEGSGIKNKAWYEKVWDAVTKPFTSWEEFVKLAGMIALVAGVAALFLTGPLGWALMATAVLAGAAVFANDLGRFARGEIGLGGLAFSALGLIPGARGVVSLAKLGAGAAGLARVVAGGGGRALIGGLRTTAAGARNAVTALPHALKVAGGLRGALSDPRLFARAFNCRFVGRDPIDLATGEMVMQQVDVDLPGVLPLKVERTFVSSYRVGRWFGPAWSSPLDQRLEVDADGVCFAGTDAVVVSYAHPAPGETVLPEEGPRWPLTRTTGGAFTLSDPDTGRALHFASPPSDLPDDGVALPLAAVVDRNGHRMDLGYDPVTGHLTEIRHSGGYLLDTDTDDQGRITEFRLRGGDGDRDIILIRYRYDAAGNLTEVVNSSGLPLRFTYDDHGRMIGWDDRVGTWYRYTYDADGRVVRTSGSARCLDGEIRYDRDNRVTVEVNSLGHATSYHYNEAWQVERVVDPLGHATTHEWDRYDRKLAVTDPLGRTTRYTYDRAGDLARVTRPDGRHTTISWNRHHQPERIVGPDAATWQREYDSRGNLTAATDPAGAVTRHGYDPLGRPTTVTDALGHTRRIETNAAGLPIAVTDPAGAVTRIQRDSFGRVIAVTDPTGGVTRFEWTVEGKPAARTLPDGTTETWRYDAEGNPIEHVVRTFPDGTRVAYTYDTELRVTSVTDPRGQVWRYDYDATGNLIRETDYDGHVLTYRYDAAGQLLERSGGSGVRLALERDALGNVIMRQAGDAVTTMAYDAVGRLVRASGPDADLRLDRDRLGRVVAETVAGRTLTTSYDALGRKLARRTPSGVESRWAYDQGGRPVELHTGGRTLYFGHDAAGRETERRFGDVATLRQSWDHTSRLTSQTVTGEGTGTQVHLLQERTFTYRPDGNVARVQDRTGGSRAFVLDSRGRVTTVNSAVGSETYDYDSAGNITHATWPAGAHDTQARGDREFAGTRIRRAGNVRYHYDTRGNLVLRQHKTPSAKPRNWHYAWDADGRLVGVTTPDGARWRYLYDPLGRRIAKQRLDDDGTVLEQTDFTWDGALLAEQTRSHPDRPGGPTTTWEWEPDEPRPLAQLERVPAADDETGQSLIDRQFYAIVTDVVGTPADLIDENGHLTPQGWAPLWSGAAPDAPCPLRFPGQYDDPESGLRYNLFRHYDPETALYTSPDPLGLAPGPNPRHYVQNPLAGRDPLGLAPQDYIRVRPGQQAPGPEFNMSNAELDFVRRLIGPGGRTNLHVYRTPDGIGKGDFVVIDQSNPQRLVGWVAELGSGKGAAHAGHQLRNAAEVQTDLGVRQWEKVFGTTDELLDIMKRGRGDW